VCTGVLVIVCTFILHTGLVHFQFTEVPDVCGVTLRDAREKIHNAGLSFAMVPGINYDENRVSEVTGQSVDAYTIVQKETKVTVYIQSKLTEIPDIKGMISVPNVVGMEQMEATELLTESGLQFQVWWTGENNIEAEQYYIIDQSIPADSQVPAGTLVKLELSPKQP
jgi:beta-lactam-binding protein with PASTA domain